MSNNRKSSSNGKSAILSLVIVVLTFWVVGSTMMAISYSTESTAATSEIEKQNQRSTTRRSQLENLKSKLATSMSQEYIMAQVTKYNLGLSASSRGQVKQISTSMVSNSRFNRNTSIVAYSE
ncbi:MAG: hypothetical protein KAG98_02335 [Lentisphaeria bacterium]|nr:hypothetical protein [Lentisphaeria bacterium]